MLEVYLFFFLALILKLLVFLVLPLKITADYYYKKGQKDEAWKHSPFPRPGTKEYEEFNERKKV